MRTDQQTVTVPVSGMTCAACEKRVGKALRALDGVDAVSVSAARGVATLRGHVLPDREQVEAAIRSAGYEPAAPAWLTSDRGVWRTVAIAVVAVALLAWLFARLGPLDVTSSLMDPSRGGLLVVLALGLAAGVSTCMAMVGGLVLGFSAAHAAAHATSTPASRQPPGGTGLPFLVRMRPQLAFNAGRVVGFGVLGAVLGAIGSTMSPPTRVLAVLVLGVAVVMFLLGVRLTGISPRVAAWSPRLPGGLARGLGIDTATQRSYSHTRTALIGAATFFLPCGFTQAVQLYALSTASPMTAGVIMATFALGTAPGLLALGSVPELTTGARQTTVLRVVGVVVLAFGLLNVSSALNLLGVAGPGGGSAAAGAQTASANVTVAEGIQTVRMTQNPRGYEPADTVLYAGLPTRWVIEGTSPFDCSAFVRVPALDLKVDLAMGPNTVDLPALDEGEVPFTCVMGMYSGTLVVIDQPDGIS